MSYLRDVRDLLCHILGAVFDLAGRDDLNLGGRRWSQGESDLGNTADGPGPHQIRIGGGVQGAGLQVCTRDKPNQIKSNLFV